MTNIVEISYSRSDGNGESGRETKTRFFEDFSSAVRFAQSGVIASNDFARVASSQIYEYSISSIRQLEYRKHEVVTEVKETKWCWE